MSEDLKAVFLLAVIFGPFILMAIYGSYMRHYGATGKHHSWDDDYIPEGQVWFACGEWRTMTRRRVSAPRLFGSRSNPLDHEESWETYQECRERRRFVEVEY